MRNNLTELRHAVAFLEAENAKLRVAHDTDDRIKELTAESARFRELVRKYADPFNVEPADHALVLAIGTDDEDGIRTALKGDA